MPAARSASPNAPPTSAASATWRAPSRKAISRAARVWASRWRRARGPTKSSPRSTRKRAPDMTTATNDFRSLLVELVCEELPPKALKKLGESFASTMATALKASGLAGDSAQVTGFASPRRLGLHLTGVAAKAADRAVLQKLMPASVAFDK